HVADERAVLDEDAALRRVPLVVDVDGAARLPERGVVDHGAEGAGHGLADLAAVAAGALAGGSGLQALPARLVQAGAAVTGREDDLHLAGGRLVGVEHGEGHARGLPPVVLGGLVLEVAHGHAAASAAHAPLTLAVLLGDDVGTDLHQRLHVVDEGAVA